MLIIIYKKQCLQLNTLSATHLGNFFGHKIRSAQTWSSPTSKTNRRQRINFCICHEWLMQNNAQLVGQRDLLLQSVLTMFIKLNSYSQITESSSKLKIRCAGLQNTRNKFLHFSRFLPCVLLLCTLPPHIFFHALLLCFG